MKRHILSGSICLAFCCTLATSAYAESKRVRVYPLTQSYVDTRAGDTLSEVVTRLLPNNSHLQTMLMAEIVRLNPGAFIQRDPNRLLANTRLWLPNQANNAVRTNDDSDYRVESYSWGSVKRPR